MKTNFTSLKKNQKFSPVLFCQAIAMVLLFMTGVVKEGYGQTKVFVKSIESQSNVDNANNVLVGQGSATENTFATVNSSTLILNFAGYLEQDFDETLPANTTSYVRIGVDDAGLLNALLGGSLGDLLDDVLGILLGNHSFEIDVKNAGGSSVLSGTSANSFEGANGRIRLVQNASGQFFLAITPNAPYSRIRITDRTTGVIGASEIDVYGAYYVSNDDPCAQAFGTSYDGTGLTVDLLGIGGAGVTNPQYAIDADATNFSEIRIGTAGIGASMFQMIYFNKLSNPEDYFKVKLSVGNGGVLTADLIGNIEIRAYAGTEQVYSKKLQGGLINGLDVLGLLQSGQPVELAFGPGVAFDRVSVGYNSLISLSALSDSPIQLFSVNRYGAACPDPNPIVVTPTDPMLSQKDCATEVLSFDHANFPLNAIDGNNDTYTTLEASSGILLGGVLGEAYSGHVELGFGSPVLAGDTVYIRIDFDEETLGSLLDGSVGELLGSTVDNVLFGNHYFTVEAKDGTSTVLERSSNNGFDDALGQGAGKVRIVQDKNGHYYVAVTSDAAFSSIRITENLSSLVGLGTIEHMNVYHACFSTGSELCEQAFATYSESDGISLDLLGVGDAGVSNAHLAIDDDDLSVEDDNTYSELGIGTAGVGASTFQFVDFHTLSSPADYFKIKLGVENGSLLDVELLNNIEIRAYNGDELVYSQRLQNGLVAGLDILGLLTTDNVVTIPIGPGKAFNRVAVGVSTLVDVNALSQPVRIYSIKRFGVGCPDPNPLPNNPETESPFTGPDCGITLGEFDNTNFAYNAIDGDIDTYATLSAGSGVILGGGAYSGYIELGYDQPVPALETSYIRIDMADEGLLDALVGGSLGSILADVGDILIFGNHYFDISVRDDTGTEIYNESSSGGLDNNNVRIVRDEFGRYYIAFTADVPYQSVRITLNNTAVAGLDAVTTMNVYSMCRETVFDPCEQATFTSFDGTGLTANLLEGANPAGVINPQYVIDGNNSNYAEFSLGTAAIGATLYQDIYFKTKVTTTATDKLRLRMQVPDALLNADLLGAYKVYLYNGDTEVYDATLQSALINGLDLLGLLNSGGRVSVEFAPGTGITYDRVRFEVGSVASVGIANPVRLYNVYRISDACPDPEFETPPFDVCADVIVDAGENVDDIQNLTDGNNNSYATIRSDAGLVAGIGAYSGYMELGFAGIVPAGTSSYIRIGYEEDILNSLLAGSIGGLVNGVLNGVALGDHYFNVIIKDGSGNQITNGSGSSQNLFADAAGQIRLVQDTKGRYYLEVTPTVDYQSIRLEDHTTALLGALSSEGHLDVYGMCHTPTTFECPAAFTTSYEGNGLSLDALNAGGAGVQNAFWAIDQNTSSASTLSLGTLNVGGSIQQNIQFDRVLAAGDPIQIKMKVGSGTLDAGVLSDLEVIGYLDGVEVFSSDFNTAFVEAGIVALLNAADPAVVTINPTGDIDELVIRLSSVASVSVAPNVSIYHIIPLCQSFAESFLTVTKNNALADGTDYNEVTATILNQDGDPVDNQEVEFTIVNVDGTTSTETATTNAAGEAVVEIRSTIAGDATITATVGAMIIAEGSPAIVTFIIPNNLSITKASDETDGRVTAGESTTFTLTITNDGPAPIAVGKVIPLNERPGTGLTITNYAVTSGNATVTGTGNSASATVTAAVPVDGTITLTVTADVAANAPDEVFNGIDVWGPDRDPSTDTPDDIDDIGPIPVDRNYGLDGNITKIASDGTDAVAIAGEAFEYTVTVVNGGPSTILSGTVLYLQDALSAGQTINSIVAGSANITVGTVAADGSFTVTANEDIEEIEQFTLTVTADVASDIVEDVVNNTINIWSTDPAGDYSTPEGTFTTPDYPVDRDYGFDEPEAVVKLATDGSTAVATAGEAFSYTAILTNMGPSTINAGTVLYLQDLASAGQTVTGITSDNGTVGAIGSEGEFTLTVANAVAPNGTIVLTVSVDVATDIAAEIVNNTINVWSDNPAGDYSTPEGTDTTPDYPVDRDYGFDDDHIAKVAVDGASAVAIAGEEFAYTVTVTNGGPSTILAGTELYLLDELSAGQTISSITSGDVTVGTVGADGFFTVTANADIAAGGTFTLTVTADVAANIAEDEVSNTIHIWADDPAGVYDNPDGTATTPPYPVDRDYGFDDDHIAKVAVDGASAVAVAGEEFAYTVTVTNAGPSTILAGTELYLLDELSAGQAISSITSGDVTVGTVGADGFFTVTANADIAAGGTFTLTVTADVAANIAEDEVSNTIHIWADDPAGVYDNPDGTATTPPYLVDRDYNFDNITKEAANGPGSVATAGEEFAYTVTVTNGGPSTILSGTMLYLQDDLSAGQAISSITSGDVTVGTVGADGFFTVTANADIAAGGTFTLTVTADVATDIAADIVNNTINIWSDDPDGDPSNPEGTDTTPDYDVDRESNLSITKVADDARVIAGGSTSFTVTVTNNGPSAILTGEVISLGERPSTGLTITNYEVTSGNGTATSTGNSSEVTTSAVVPVGGTISLTVTADVDADAPATVANGIDVWGPDKDPGTDPKDDGDDTPDIPVDRESNLSITKVADDARVIAGGSTSFTVTVTNDGPSAIASGKVISLGERPSTGLTITNYEVISGNGTATNTGNSSEITTSAVIPVGGTITLTVTADVDADAPATVANGIDVWGPDKDPGTDPKDDGDDTPDIPVDRESSLSITKVADDARVKAGESTSFTLTITNDGPSAIASGEVISLGERPSTGLTITNYEVTSGNGTAAGTGNSGTVTTSAVIPVGGTITLTVTADVNADAPATVSNGIDVWGPDKDPGTDPKDDGDDTPDIPVDRESNLSITKVADEARVKAGENTSFTLTITNDGPSAIASGKVISLSERPSTGVTITGYEVTSGNGTAAGTGNSATVTTNATIAVGGTITVKVTADVAANAPETITNGITVWGPDKDPGTDPEDDKDDTPPIPVDRESSLSITKVADDTRVKAGESTSFTLTITNNGPSEIANGKVINLTERPGTGVTITGYEVTSGNGTAAGTGNKATVTTNTAIAVGGTIVVKVNADVAANAPSTITNGITVWGPDKDPGTDPEDDKDDTPPIPVDRESALSITKKADQARVKAGENTSFTLTITNNGPSEIASGKVINLVERPSTGVTISGYSVSSGNGTIAGTGNMAKVTTNKIIAVGGTIVVKVTAKVDADAPATITNGISVWGPDKPSTDPEDDKDDTPPIPVDRESVLSITKVADEDRVKAGESTSFTVTITNNGPAAIANGKVINLTERPSTGVTITAYEVTSGNGTAAGTGNTATVTTQGVIAVGGTITVKITADIAVDAPETITNGISVWGPDKPTTEDPDDEDDTPEIPVDYQAPKAVDDRAETKSGIPVVINVLANDEELKWKIDPTTVEIVDQPSNGGTVSVSIDGAVSYTSKRGYEGSDSFTYRVKDENGNWSNAGTVTVTVLPNPLEFPNVFTPNGDGLNDVFEIKGLDQYPENELMILNRWGNQVYLKVNYTNDWTGDNLTEGTYYYILKVKNGADEWDTYKGPVALIRVTK